jgi:hypothetical protein
MTTGVAESEAMDPLTIEKPEEERIGRSGKRRLETNSRYRKRLELGELLNDSGSEMSLRANGYFASKRMPRHNLSLVGSIQPEFVELMGSILA